MKLWYIGVGNKNRTVATLYMLVDWEACLGWLVGEWVAGENMLYVC